MCKLSPIVLFKEGPVAFSRRIAARLPFVKRVEEVISEENGQFLASLEEGDIFAEKSRPEKVWQPMSFKHFDKVEVSIIIPVYNQCFYTFKCLQSILENTAIAYEVIVVDNASREETASMLDSMEGIRVIRN